VGGGEVPEPGEKLLAGSQRLVCAVCAVWTAPPPPPVPLAFRKVLIADLDELFGDVEDVEEVVRPLGHHVAWYGGRRGVERGGISPQRRGRL